MTSIYVHRDPLKPLYFLMENVASMSNENRDKITAALDFIFKEEVELLKINSALVSGANRRRYYWTNTVPPDKGIQFKDVLENGFVDRDKANVILSTNVTLTNGIGRYYTRRIGNIVFKDQNFAELPTDQKMLEYPFILNKAGYNGKARILNQDEYSYPNGCYRLPSVLETERLMTFPVSDVPKLSRTEKLKLLELSFTCDVVAHLFKPLLEAL
jgi:site-specific DNA-cytosine methylase